MSLFVDQFTSYITRSFSPSLWEVSIFADVEIES